MKLYSENANYKLYKGDMRNMLDIIEKESIDVILTDPPYELNFMNKGWDNSGIAFQSDTWKKCYEALKPGGYLLAFGGSRTFHRIACAIEDAGFEIRDTIMYMYGSGFPKSMNIGKQLEKRLEDEKTKQKTEHDLLFMWERDIQKTKSNEKTNEVVLQSQLQEQSLQVSGNTTDNVWREEPSVERWNNIQKTERELQWCQICEMSKRVLINGEERWICNGTQTCDGKTLRKMFEQSGSCTSYRSQSEKQQNRELNVVQEQCRTQENREVIEYWNKFGTALKPSFEPIIVARKPFKGSLVDNIIQYGVGGINIDECRVGNEVITQLQKDMTTYHSNKLGAGHHTKMTGITTQTVGRFPANTILTYDETDFDEVCGGFPNTKSTYNKDSKHETEIHRDNADILKYGFKTRIDSSSYNDSGSASRYFYCAKASKKDRDEGIPNKWLDNIELILYNDVGDELWKDKITTKEENKAKHLEDMGVSLKKVIEEYGIQTKKDIDLNMLLCGKKSLEKYLKENKYTTKMEINSTTILQILNLLTLYTTKENTQDAKLETENGTSHVKIVGCSNQLQIIIKDNQELVPGANNVVLKMLLKINEKEGRNEHCTVKPTTLMQYLVRLVTPNGGTILDPFNGSGSTGKAVMYENKERNKNYKYIGIELTEEYLPISKARIEYVCNLIEEEKTKDKQLSIFDKEDK